MNFEIENLPKCKITKESDSSEVVKNCYLARTLSSRFFGLMGMDSLPASSGLIIEPCNSIHTFFMKFAIDVFYLKREKNGIYSVVKVARSMKPWRMGMIVFSADAVLETSAALGLALSLGERICLS